MKTTWKRLQTLFFGTFNPTVGLLVGIFVASLIMVRQIPTSTPRMLEYRKNKSGANLSFEIDLDLSSQFNFNLKQVFVYLRAVYLDDGGNSEVVWSRIVGRKSVKQLQGIFRNSYNLVGSFEGRVMFELRGCYIPFVGTVKDVMFGSSEIKI